MKLKKKLWQILWLVDFNVETFVILEHMQKMSFAGDYAEKKKTDVDVIQLLLFVLLCCNGVHH